MRVREFALRAGVAPNVVRYYMRNGLLRPRRTAMHDLSNPIFPGSPLFDRHSGSASRWTRYADSWRGMTRGRLRVRRFAP
jgi:hypothetical protein